MWVDVRVLSFSGSQRPCEPRSHKASSVVCEWGSFLLGESPAVEVIRAEIYVPTHFITSISLVGRGFVSPALTLPVA